MQSARKPMPVGVEDFKRLVTAGYCFIDKTRFIKDYIDAQGVAKAQEALAQIEEKAYGAEMARLGVKEIWRYGIALYGKLVYMAGA